MPVVVRTLPGIRNRILLAFILLTLIPAAAVSWLGWQAVDAAIDQRLVRQPVVNAARVVSEMRLPLTPLMMQRLTQTLGQGDQLAAELQPDGIGEAIVSSLDEPRAREFIEQLKGRGTRPPAVTLAGQPHTLGSAEMRDVEGRTRTLYLMVDQRVLRSAKSDALRPILIGSIPVLIGVILIGIRIAHTITQPIRTLSHQMEKQFPANQKADEIPDAQPEIALDAPRELAELASTFNRMLGRLRQTQHRLLDAERLAAIGKIAASVAHEVRNPLAGIRMNLQLLEQHLHRQSITDESLPIIISEVDRLDVIVQEMLILGRNAEPKLQPVDLRSLLDEVVHLLDRRLQHGNVVARVSGDAITAQVDPAQIKQVLLNLILNATDAMPQGGAITLQLSRERDHCRIQIDDTGTGLSLPDGQDPFAWFSTSKSAGSGIGLAVCRQIIEAHQGKIGLMNLEKGTRAWIELAAG